MISQAQYETRLRSQFLPPPSMVWWHWSRDGGVILSPRVPTPLPGAYDLTRTPALIGVAEAIDDPDTVQAIAKKGAQIGLTQLVLAWLACRVKFDPGPMMIVVANEKLAKQRSRNTMKPLFEDSPELKMEIRPGRESWTDLEYQFTRCNLYWVGGQSPSGLASNPIRYLYVDEENKFQDAIDEGDNVELAIERTKNFKWNKKIIRTCTPTTEDGRISRAYEKGDKRRFHVRCPHCQHRQVMRWEQVKDVEGRDWHGMDSQDAADGARYFCEACAKPWTELQRIDAIADAGKEPDRGWIASGRAKERGVVSFHMPSFISNFVSVSDMVAKFLHAKETPSELRNFINSWLAEDWVPQSRRVKSETLTNCKAGYAMCEDPTTCPCIKVKVAGLPFKIFTHGDVQAKGIWAWTQVYWAGGSSAMLGWKWIETGSPQGDYKALNDFSKVEYMVCGKMHPSGFASIDCGDGNRTREIYEAAMQLGFMAAKGSNHPLDLLFEERAWSIETGRRGNSGDNTIDGILFDTDAIKHNLVALMDGTHVDTAEQVEAGARTIGPQFWLPHDVPESVTAQLTSEEYNMGTEKWQMKKGKAGSAGNHLWDCSCNVYGMACWAGYTFKRIDA